MAWPIRSCLTSGAVLLAALGLATGACAGGARPAPASSGSTTPARGTSAPGPPAPGPSVPPATSAPATSAPVRSTQPAGGGDWPTYHHDQARSGAAATGPDPTTARVRWTHALAGPVQAEPLVVGDEVLVATEDDTVAAYSTATGARRWQTALGQPVAGSALPCGDISPSGITGTPAADVGRGLVWVVAFVQPGQHQLVGLRLDNGQVVSRRVVDPPGASPLVEQQRGALALSDGLVDIAFGGLYGDCGDYHGYVVGAAEDGSGALRSFQVAASQQGGIWAPSGPAVDAAGELYVASGNGSPPGGDNVIRLSPELAEIDSFAPADAVAMDGEDLDLGSTGPVLLPGGLVFQVGKTGFGYLLQAGRLGGSGGQLQSVKVCTAAFGGDAVAAGRVYVPCVDGIVALHLVSATTLAVAWRSAPFSAGSPVVAGSTVWALDPYRGRLLGFDAATGARQASLSVGRSARFGTPAVAAGQLYLVAGGRLVDVGS